MVEAGGPPGLTSSKTRIDIGIGPHCVIIDRASAQSEQIELANLWQTAVGGARPCNRPVLDPA
jgi:hypothetical protein